MGRWAQARRRGGGGRPSGAIGPPPAPTLAIVNGFLLQTAGGGNDAGAAIWLRFSEEEGGPYFDWGEAVWAAVYDWGLIEELSVGWCEAVEVGNGVAYAGRSDPSNRVEINP